MATYVPNATDTTQPTSDKFVSSAAEEFRAIKTELALVKSTGGTGSMTGTQIAAAISLSANTAPVTIDTTPVGVTTNSLVIKRNASYSGGTPGWVNAALFLDTTIGSTSNSFEWGLLSRINNSASGGNNVGGYFQGNRLAPVGCPTWGAVAEICDSTNEATTTFTSSTVGLEVDVWCNGSDNYTRRIGVDVLAGNAQLIRNGVPGIGKGIASVGIRVAAANFDDANGAFNTGIVVASGLISAITIQSTGTIGIWDIGTHNVGIDLSNSTNSQAAIRIKANEYIALEGTNVIKLKYNPTSSSIEFYNGSTRRGYINMSSGSDTDLAGSAPTNMVTTNTTQTISGFKLFTNNVNIDVNNTVAFSSAGNVRFSAGTSSTQLRVLIDGSPYYIPLYTA